MGRKTNRKDRNDISHAKGQRITNIYFDLGSIVIEFESGDVLKLYDMSGVGIDPKWR